MNKLLVSVMLLSPVVLAGCVSFVPNYRQDLYDKLTDTQTQLRKVSVEIDTGGNGVPYATVEPYFVAALADISQAQDIADASSKYYKGKLAGKPADTMLHLIKNCAASVGLAQSNYKQSSPPPANAKTQVLTAADACSIPKTSADLMKR